MIDTDVLVRAANGDEGHGHCFNVLQLLGTIRASGQVIVLDHNGYIDREYRRNLDQEGLVYRFLAMLASRGQIRYVSGSLNNRIARGLRRLSFDADDDVFIAVATRTTTHRLVAEESDYSDTVVDYLVSEGVRVIDCEAAATEANE